MSDNIEITDLEHARLQQLKQENDGGPSDDVEKQPDSLDSKKVGEEAQKQESFKQTLETRIAEAVAIASILVCSFAMAWERSVVTYIMGVVAIFVGVVCLFYQNMLQNTDTLRRVQNELRDEVSRLHGVNKMLSDQVLELDTQASRLKVQETKLEEITNKQGANVEEFVVLVKDNGVITDQLKTCVRAEALQILIGAIIDSDWDKSLNFSDQELKMLEMRLQNIPGIVIDFELLEKRVKASDKKLSSVLDMVQDIESGKRLTPENEHIFQIEDEKMLQDLRLR